MKKYLGIIVAFSCISIALLQPPLDIVQRFNESKTVLMDKRSGPGEAWARTVDHIEERKVGVADVVNPVGHGRGRGFRVASGRGGRGGRGRDGSSFGGFDGGDTNRRDDVIGLEDNRGLVLRPPGYNFPGPPLVVPNYDYDDERFRNGPGRLNGWRDYGGRPGGGYFYR